MQSKRAGLGRRLLAFIALLFGGLGCSKDLDRTEPPSVVLIVVDTLRADHIGAYGYERETTPHLDRRIPSGRLFERAWSTASWTLPSFGSLLTGELPCRHGAQGYPSQKGSGGSEFRRLAAETTTLAESFAGAGYATGAVANNGFLSPSFGFDRGFQSYDHVSGDNKTTRRADEIINRSLAWIDDQSRPFFLLVHLFDPHMTYDAPKPARGSFTSGISSQFSLPLGDLRGIRGGRYRIGQDDLRFLRAAYDEEVLFVDREIERFFGELEARGLWDRCLVVLTADHGEEIFDHGGFEHGHAMWEELLRVPLVFWGPGIQPGRTAMPVSIVDVYPTLLAATGLAMKPDSAGISLWPHLTNAVEIEARSVIAERSLYGPNRQAILRGSFKLIHDPTTDQSLLFDLSRDPKELRDIAAQRRDLARGLAKELALVMEKAGGKRVSTEAELDEATRENLRLLGYTE